MTREDLDRMAKLIDLSLGLPEGTHEIQWAYGKPRLVRDNGAKDVSPRLPSGELLSWMHAYFDGIEVGQQRWRARLSRVVTSRPAMTNAIAGPQTGTPRGVR